MYLNQANSKELQNIPVSPYLTRNESKQNFFYQPKLTSSQQKFKCKFAQISQNEIGKSSRSNKSQQSNSFFPQKFLPSQKTSQLSSPKLAENPQDESNIAYFNNTTGFGIKPGSSNNMIGLETKPGLKSIGENPILKSNFLLKLNKKQSKQQFSYSISLINNYKPSDAQISPAEIFENDQCPTNLITDLNSLKSNKNDLSKLQSEKNQKKNIFKFNTFETLKQTLNQKNQYQLVPPRNSIYKCGQMKSFAANTDKGIVRNYNEDRVSIIVDINKNYPGIKQFENSSYFAVFDGHGGNNCANFLKDNLHNFIFENPKLLLFPKEAIMQGFEKAEDMLMNQFKINHDRSGSCALVSLIIGDMCYLGNVGDSRAILSLNGGKSIQQITRDHKPTDYLERQRILNAGGKIYQSKYEALQGQIILGPHRVFPGRLSVTRSIGDFEAKLEQFGGNPNVIISKPDIISFKIEDYHDFLILASDGIYDKITNEQIIETVWNIQKEKSKILTLHEYVSIAVENIMKLSIENKTQDNITVVLIGFSNLKRNLNCIRRELKSSFSKPINEQQNQVLEQIVQKRKLTYQGLNEKLHFVIQN